MGKNSIYPTNTHIKRKTMTIAALEANRANAAKGGRPAGTWSAQKLSVIERCRRNDERHVEILEEVLANGGERVLLKAQIQKARQGNAGRRGNVIGLELLLAGRRRDQERDTVSHSMVPKVTFSGPPASAGVMSHPGMEPGQVCLQLRGMTPTIELRADPP